MLGPGAPLGSGAGDPQSVQLPLFTTCVEPSGHLEKGWDSLRVLCPHVRVLQGSRAWALCAHTSGAPAPPAQPACTMEAGCGACTSVEEVPSATTFAPQVKRTVSVAKSPSQSIAMGPSSASPASQTWETH